MSTGQKLLHIYNYKVIINSITYVQFIFDIFSKWLLNSDEKEKWWLQSDLYNIVTNTFYLFSPKYIKFMGYPNNLKKLH